MRLRRPSVIGQRSQQRIGYTRLISRLSEWCQRSAGAYEIVAARFEPIIEPKCNAKIISAVSSNNAGTDSCGPGREVIGTPRTHTSATACVIVCNRAMLDQR